jgi:hypothetical protein
MRTFGAHAADLCDACLTRVERAHSGWALFAALLPLLLLMLAPTAWNSNEENYFQLAYQQVAPEKFGEHHAVFDSSKARVIAETFVGAAVDSLGYERAHFVLRIVLAFAYAAGLAIFFAAVEISVLESLLVVAVFCAMGEQLIGGEWLFKGVEAKTFAYSLLFMALGFAYRSRWLVAIALAAVATYLHFLVGGFWTLMLLFIQLTRQRQFKPVLLSVAMFAVLVAPLLIVVVPHDVVSLVAAAPSQGPSADVIYAEVRGAEHLAPFRTRWEFWTWLPGIVVTVCLLGVLAGLQRRSVLPPIGVPAMTALSFLLFALVIAFFDRHNYYLAKFYLFRPSSLALFLAISAIVLAIRRQCSDSARAALTLVAAAFITVFTWDTVKAQVDIVRSAPAIPYERELLEAIEGNSGPADIVLIEPFNEMHPGYVRLHRVIPRPTLVSWKFAPTDPADILRWHDLIKKRERMFAEGCAAPMQPPVKLLLIFHKDVADRMRECGDVIWQRDEALLMRVRE